MDYKEFAKDLLKKKNKLIAAKKIAEMQSEDIKNELYACKTSQINEIKVDKSRRSNFDDRLINLIVEKDDCEFRIRVITRELRMIEMGMSALNEYQADLLEYFFISEEKGAAEHLMGKYYKERSCLYDDRAKALEDFTRAVYGILFI